MCEITQRMMRIYQEALRQYSMVLSRRFNSSSLKAISACLSESFEQNQSQKCLDAIVASYDQDCVAKLPHVYKGDVGAFVLYALGEAVSILLGSHAMKVFDGDDSESLEDELKGYRTAADGVFNSVDETQDFAHEQFVQKRASGVDDLIGNVAKEEYLGIARMFAHIFLAKESQAMVKKRCMLLTDLDRFLGSIAISVGHGGNELNARELVHAYADTCIDKTLEKYPGELRKLAIDAITAADHMGNPLEYVHNTCERLDRIVSYAEEIPNPLRDIFMLQVNACKSVQEEENLRFAYCDPRMLKSISLYSATCLSHMCVLVDQAIKSGHNMYSLVLDIFNEESFSRLLADTEKRMHGMDFVEIGVVRFPIALSRAVKTKDPLVIRATLEACLVEKKE